MAVSSYRNFDLLITRSEDTYRAFVVDAPGGDADVTFALPFTWDELDFLADLSGVRRGGTGQRPPGAAPDLEELGSRLFGAIFQGKVAAVLAASQTLAEQEQAGLRLRLRFSQETSELATLPWEILYDPVQERFLALSESSPILRYLSLPKARPTLLVEPPLRVLAVLVSPPGYEPLDLEREWQVLETALADLVANDTFVLERLESPTLAALQERLLGEEVHILHFVGHGVFDEDAGGSLVLADENGDAQEVPGEELATLLHNHSSLRLVYLNACEGALSSHLTVFSGVAQTLVQQGVPAAVAMQAEITDEAAIELSRTFYAALARGYPVDAALTQARVAVARRSAEWAIPVLFSRSPDNRLFNVVDVLPEPACPYPGMVPFSEEQAHVFFGREREIEEAVERLRQHPFLTVIGPSGSGKSSLVYAGVIPALRRSKRFGEGDWSVHTMRPSDRRTPEGQAAPMTALRDLLQLPEDVFISSDRSPNLQSPNLQSPTLLFVDQFEELFTLADPDEAQAFLDALEKLTGHPNLYILLTVRADFYPDLMACTLWPPIRANRLELTPLGEEELWAAIVQPAARVGVTVEDALAVQLIADAAGEAGVLPLVQETLVLLWEKVERRQLKLEHYRGMAEGGRSGLQVAIDRRASTVYNNLPEAAQPIARRVFLRLVQFGEGRLDTRRQQTVEELRASRDDPALFDETLRTLVDARLLTASGEEGDPQRRVDIAHEALIQGWGLLRRWIQEKREAERIRRRLEEKATEWLRLERSGGLLDDYELHEAESWLEGPDAEELGISQTVLDLVAASQEALARAEAEKAAQHQRELEQARKLAEEQRLRAEEREQAASSLRKRLVAAIVAIIVAALAFAAAAWFGLDAERQRNNAEQALATATVAQGQAQVEAENARNAQATAEMERQRADNKAAEAERSARRALAGQTAAVGRNLLIVGQANTAALIALSAMQGLTYTASLENLLWDSLDRWRLMWQFKYRDIPEPSASPLSQQLALDRTIRSLYFFRDDRYLAATYSNGVVALWEMDSGRPLLVDRYVEPATGALLSLEDASYFITSGLNGEVRIWDRVERRLIHTLQHPGPVRSIALHPNGKWIAARVNNQVYLWDIASGEAVDVSPYTTAVELRTVGFTQDGQNILAGGNDNGIHVWHIPTGQHAFLAPAANGHQGPVLGVQQSPDSRYIAGLSRDLLLLWDQDLQPVELVGARGGSFSGELNFTSDGSVLLAGTSNGGVYVWDLGRTDRPPLAINFGPGTRVNLSPDNRYIAVLSQDTGKVELLDLLSRSRRTLEQLPPGFSARPVFNRSGKLLAIGDNQGDIYLLNVWVGANSSYYPLNSDLPPEAFSRFRDDSILVVGAGDKITLWDTTKARKRDIQPDPAENLVLEQDPYSLVLTEINEIDDQSIVVGDNEGNISRISFDTVNDKPSARIESHWAAHQGRIMALDFAAEHSLLLSAGADAQIRGWDVDTHALRFTLTEPKDAVTAIVHQRDQDIFFASSLDGAIRSWDWNGNIRSEIALGTPLAALAINHVNGLLAAAGVNEVIYVVDASLQRIVAEHPVNHPPQSLAFMSANRLAVGMEDGSLNLWDWETQSNIVFQAHSSWIKDILVIPEEQVFLTLGNDGLIFSWPLSLSDLRNLACARHTNSTQILTKGKWNSLFGFPMPASPCQGVGPHISDPWRISTGPASEEYRLNGLPTVVYYFEPDHYVWKAPSDKSFVRLRWASDNATAVYLETYQAEEGKLIQKARDPVGSPQEVVKAIDANTVFRLVVEAPDGRTWYRTVHLELQK